MKEKKTFETALAVSRNGKTLEFGVMGYEFPECGPEEDVYDNNWLRLKFSYHDSERSASCTDCCLLTWELEDIVKYLPAFLDSDADTFEIEFMESTLYGTIERLEDGKFKLSLVCAHEGKLGGGLFTKEAAVQHLDERELRRVAAYARLALMRWPVR